MDRTITALDDPRDKRHRRLFCLTDLSERDALTGDSWMLDGA
jgi:hypothetical protein